MHLCWNDDRTGKSEVYYRKFHGTFWGPEQRISPDDSIRSENPSMTLDGDGRPFIFYRDRRYGPWQVICARWDGARWIEERVTEHENDVNNPACVTDPAGGINVFWESETGGTREIYHRVRGDSGWGESTKLAAFWSHSPTCACDSQGRVMVVWTESWYGKLRGALRYGGEWHDLAGIPGNGWSPNLTADGLGRFHLVYARNGKIDYQWYGETWSTPTRINRGTHGNTPFVAVDAAGHSIVIWTAGKDQDTRIMARRWEGDAAVTAVDETVAAPAEFGFARTEPNPFKAGTEIMFGLPFASDVSVSVFDVTGRLVWREDTEQLDPGFHSVVWGGSDAGGRKVSPGVYFAHLTAGAKVARTKLVLLR
jgi:hypothetical protein